MKMKQLLEEILNDCSHYTKEGALAQYIPELAKADPNEFGICTISFEQGINGFGDYEKSDWTTTKDYTDYIWKSGNLIVTFCDETREDGDVAYTVTYELS